MEQFMIVIIILLSNTQDSNDHYVYIHGIFHYGHQVGLLDAYGLRREHLLEHFWLGEDGRFTTGMALVERCQRYVWIMRVKQCHKPAIWEWFIPPNTTYKNGDLGDGLYISVYMAHDVMIHCIHGKDVPFLSGLTGDGSS